jgi:ABC-type nitrate/sulfonate/bicarbonate transport system substrate-binding protein
MQRKDDTIRIGSVAEHFTMPFHRAMESGDFLNSGLEMEWTDFLGGTGQMCLALRNGEVDICALLTEGGIADICNGNPSVIIGNYVASPIMWGIFTGVDSTLSSPADIYDKRFAISRYGSGSHLIPMVDGLMKGFHLQEDQFVVVNNMEGGLRYLEEGMADVFYWENVTTRPFVQEGRVRQLGMFITPWPSFILLARQDWVDDHPESMDTFLQVLYEHSKAFMTDARAVQQVVGRFDLNPHDVKSWFNTTVWADYRSINEKTVQNVIYALQETGIIQDTLPYEKLVTEKSWAKNYSDSNTTS